MPYTPLLPLQEERQALMADLRVQHTRRVEDALAVLSAQQQQIVRQQQALLESLQIFTVAFEIGRAPPV